MNDWMGFAISGLAVWRVCHLVSMEDGPWNGLLKLRTGLARLGLSRLVGCFKCLSIWISLPFALLLTRELPEALVIWLGLSGAAILLERASEDLLVLEEGP